MTEAEATQAIAFLSNLAWEMEQNVPLFNFAITALREKAERENPKPCDGCGFQRMPERGACWGCTRNRMVFADNYTPKGAER